MFIDTTLENISGKRKIETEFEDGLIMEGIELDKYYKQYIKGAEFPMKFYCKPETMHACNAVKKLFLEGLKTISIFALFINKTKLLRAFNTIGMAIFGEHIRKVENLAPAPKAIYFLTYNFLFLLNFTPTDSMNFAKIFSNIFEYDLAYRYRIQDLFTDIFIRDLINNPRKEIKRLISVVVERDNQVVSSKFKKIATIIYYLLLIPKVKKSFISAVELLSLKDLELDQADLYWVCMRKDYNFRGKTYEERQSFIKKYGFKIPEFHALNNK